MRLNGGINIERHKSVNKTTDWHWLGDRDAQRLNPSIDPGNSRSVVLRADFEGESAGPSRLFGQRKIALEVEHSRPGFGSDFAFTQFRLLLDWRIETLFKRRLLPNVLDVRVVGSTFTGTLPRQRFEILDSGLLLGGISTFGGFRTHVDRPYEGEQVLGVFWEHHFRTVPFELIGWRWAAEQNIGLTIHGGHGRTWFGDRTLAGLDYKPQYLDGVHHELGRVDQRVVLSLARGFYRAIGCAGLLCERGNSAVLKMNLRIDESTEREYNLYPIVQAGSSVNRSM